VIDRKVSFNHFRVILTPFWCYDDLLFCLGAY